MPARGGPARGPAFGYRPVYVHAKVAIIDDEWLTVGSANLNNRGFVTDSELNVVVRDPSLARALRMELWSEHLGIGADDLGRTTANAVIDSTWKEQAKGSIQTRTTTIAPGRSRGPKRTRQRAFI